MWLTNNHPCRKISFIKSDPQYLNKVDNYFKKAAFALAKKSSPVVFVILLSIVYN